VQSALAYTDLPVCAITSDSRQSTAKAPASMSNGDDETECRTRHSVSARKFLRRFYWIVMLTEPELTTW
jgi:hypothetical protein